MDGVTEPDMMGLFINNVNGTPLCFCMGPTGAERQLAKQLVEEGGGNFFDRRPNLQYRDSCIKLVAKGEIPLKKDEDMFDFKYVVDCSRAGRILPNLLDYRINTRSQFAEYDPVDILLGNCQWSTLPKRDEGERVSDIEDLDEHDVARADREFKMFKSGRYSYSKKEQLDMLGYIFKRRAYKLLKGNVIWQRMEENKICGGRRTWQSMKEHFRKQVMPKIHHFGITDRQIRKLRACYDLDVLHSSDESTDSEDEIPYELQKRLRPESRAGPLLEKRPDPPSENRPDPPSENRAGSSLQNQQSTLKSVSIPLSVVNPISSEGQLSKSNIKSPRNVVVDGGATSDPIVDNSDQPSDKTVNNLTETGAKPVAGPSISYKKTSIAISQPKRWLGKAKLKDKSERGRGTFEDAEATEKSEAFKTAEDLLNTSEDSESKIVKHGVDIGVAATGLNETMEEDPEELLDQSQLPPHQRSMRLTPPHKRKRRLYSVENCFLDSPVDPNESVDMFDNTPPRGRKKIRNARHEPIVEEEGEGEVSGVGVLLPESSQEFELGLKQVSGKSALSTVEVEGAVTSTQFLNTPAEVLQDGQQIDGEQEKVTDQAVLGEERESIVDQQEIDVTDNRNVDVIVKLNRRPVINWREEVGQEKENSGDNIEDLRKKNNVDIEKLVEANSPNVEGASAKIGAQEQNDQMESIDQSLVAGNSRERESIFSQTKDVDEPLTECDYGKIKSKQRKTIPKNKRVIAFEGDLSQNELRLFVESSEDSQKMLKDDVRDNPNDSIDLLAVADDIAGPALSDSQEVNDLLALNSQDDPELPDSQEINNLLALNTQDLQRMSPTSQELLYPKSQPDIHVPILRTDTYTLSQPHVEGLPIIESLNVDEKDDDEEENIEEAQKVSIDDEAVTNEDQIIKEASKETEQNKVTDEITLQDKEQRNEEVHKQTAEVDGESSELKKNGDVSTMAKQEMEGIGEVHKEIEDKGEENLEEGEGLEGFSSPRNKSLPIPSVRNTSDGESFFEPSDDDEKVDSKEEERIRNSKKSAANENLSKQSSKTEKKKAKPPSKTNKRAPTPTRRAKENRKNGPYFNSLSKRGGRSKGDRREVKKYTEHLVVVAGLPSDIDSSIELVRPGNVHMGVNTAPRLPKERRKEVRYSTDSYPKSRQEGRRTRFAKEATRDKEKGKDLNTTTESDAADLMREEALERENATARQNMRQFEESMRSSMRSRSPRAACCPGFSTFDGKAGGQHLCSRRASHLSSRHPSPDGSDDETNDSDEGERGEKEKRVRRRSLSKDLSPEKSIETSLESQPECEPRNRRSKQSEVGQDSESDNLSNIGALMTSSPKVRTARVLTTSSPIAGPSGMGRKGNKNVQNDRLAKKKCKLKIIAIGKENDAEASLNYLYEQKFRTLYSHLEDRALINYFLENRGFSRRKGTTIWKLMEKTLVVAGRTWQSLKTRWNTIETKLLVRHGVTMQDLLDADQDDEDDGDGDASNMTSDTITSSASSGRNPYTVNEDLKIVKFIVETKRYDETGGTTLWKTMEERKIVPNRSWHSIKERFRKVIIGKLDQFEMGDDVRAAFKGIGGKKTEKQKRLKK